MDTRELVERVLAGERRGLGRLLSLVEDGSEAQLREATRLLHPHSGRAHLVGLTGSPGVGKSSLTNGLITHWRERQRSVAVLAVDPTSPFTGGALLGDRVRLQDHALDAGVFVRSMASRGQLGGLAWATPQAVGVLDAAGFDVVVIETVGVGQAEVEVASTADTTVVVLSPGMGDAVQVAKAGILEIADVLCVNKADRDSADRTVRDLQEMRQLSPSARAVPIQRTVASTGKGLEELATVIDEHEAWLRGEGRRHERQLARARALIRELALGRLRARLAGAGEGRRAEELAAAVARRELDPYTAADELVAAFEG